MRFFALVLLAAMLAAAGPVCAQTAPNPDVTISTDRPAVADSSVVVPQGGLQIENGFLLTNTQGGNTEDFPESAFRYGLLQKTELRLAAPDYYNNLATGSGATSGFGDLAIGVKQQLGPFHGFDVSGVFFVSLPSGAKQISSGGYDPGLQFPWSRGISGKWTAGGQEAFYWPTQGGKHNFTGETTFFVDRQLTRSSDAFVEYAGDFPERGGSRELLHFGALYRITSRQQVDFHVAGGLTHGAPRVFIGFGYSVLLVRR
jgi:hypothetical protein